MTHAFMYGTAVFEGIRAYWNEDQGVLYGLKLREHMERIRRNAGMLLMTDLPPVDELVRHRGRDDPPQRLPRGRLHPAVLLQVGPSIGVKLHKLPHDLTVLAVPFGNYIDIEKGVRLMTSTWRRNADDALPARGKIVGGYVNMAFQKSEAELNGFDEALVLTADGHASEASAANMFVVRDGVLLTPPVNDDILEGVTREAVLRARRDVRHPGRGPLDRPQRDLRRRRDVPVRHRRPAVPGHRARPPADRRRRHRPDHPAAPRRVLRRRARQRRALRALADADPGAPERPPFVALRRGRGTQLRASMVPVMTTKSTRTPGP